MKYDTTLTTLNVPGKDEMAVHAGVKRRFHQMRDFEPFALASESTQTSRSVSPTGSHRQASNGPNTLRNGQNKVEKFFDIPRDSPFDSRASVVLIGIRGVGKSTLGVLGATAYNRRLIDSDRQFTEATGSTAAAYRKDHGTKEYQKRHYQVLSSTLTTHSLDTVIVCSFTDLEGEGAALLRDYGRSHPVIHITRDAEGIRSHLQVWTIERVHQLVSASYPLLRSCSNYEFFNLSEKADYANSTGTSLSSRSEKDGQSSPTGGFLTLKRVEHDFLRLIRNIIGDDHRVIYHHSAYPLSEMNIQDRLYTCAVVVKASAIINEEHNLDEMQIGADCVELVIDLTGTEDIAKAFAAIRRATILPILLTPESRPRTTDGQESLLEVIEKCLRLGPELCKIDISLDDTHISRFIARKGYSQIICCSHLLQRPPKGWNDDECTGIYNRAVTLRCDLVEITMPADSVESAFSVASIQLKAMASPSSPRLIAYETGINSKLSKCLNKTLTPVRPPSEDGAALIQSDNEEILLTAKAITQARFAAFMLQPMQFYVYGANVSYSLSPAMHNAAYEACGMQYTYEKRSSGDLEEFKRLARSASFGGSALAQPYKTMMITLLDGMSSHAQAIGAVNTIVPVRELLPDGGLPDEVAIKTRRSGHGPVKALYGFNTGEVALKLVNANGTDSLQTGLAFVHVSGEGYRRLIRSDQAAAPWFAAQAVWLGLQYTR